MECAFFLKVITTFSHFKTHELHDLGGTWSTTYSCFFKCMQYIFFQNPWIPDPLKELTFNIMQIMFLDQLMFKNSVSAYNFTVSRKMPARGLYRKISETDMARALGCIDAGKRSREVARRFRISHQTINRIVQRYKHSGQCKDLPRSGRPSVTTRAEDRYVARNRFVTGPEVRSRLYAARGPEAHPVSVKTLRNCIQSDGFKSETCVSLNGCCCCSVVVVVLCPR